MDHEDFKDQEQNGLRGPMGPQGLPGQNGPRGFTGGIGQIGPQGVQGISRPRTPAPQTPPLKISSSDEDILFTPQPKFNLFMKTTRHPQIDIQVYPNPTPIKKTRTPTPLHIEVLPNPQPQPSPAKPPQPSPKNKNLYPAIAWSNETIKPKSPEKALIIHQPSPPRFIPPPRVASPMDLFKFDVLQIYFQNHGHLLKVLCT